MNFNESQLTAIRHFEGPALVLAGPGSGKTAVVTHRVKSLITDHLVDPSHILVITFTKAAAGEMKTRFMSLMNQGGQAVNFGTFHGVFFTMLRHAYNYRAENIIHEEEQLSLLRRIVKHYDLQYDNEKEFLSQVLQEISKVKGDGMDLEHYYAVNLSSDAFRGIYGEYNELLKRTGKIDFDDMILYTYELLKERSDILAAWQDKFRYILIDEFQDINRLQYEIVKMLAKKNKNLFIVGDDDQSIYSFRGAKPEIMLHFQDDYPGCKVICLNENYRSVKSVVESSLSLIRFNENRYQKEIVAHSKEEVPVVWKVFPDVHEEAEFFLRELLHHHENGGAYKDCALLTRTNDGARYYLEKMMEYNIPFVAKDTIPSIYNHWIARNVMAYINMALGNRDRNLFIQIMNRPKRYIGRDALPDPVVDFDELRAEYQNDRAWMLERIDRLEEDLVVLSRLNPFAAINYIRRGIGYDGFLSEYAKEMNLNEEDLFQVLNELQEASREFTSFSQWFKHIEQVEEMLRKKNQSKDGECAEDAVAVITMHGAKGLEFEKVFILDANEEVTPYKKALLNNEIEEERRMFYVAMTRAKRHLYISSVKTRFNKELDVSRFVAEAKGEATYKK